MNDRWAGVSRRELFLAGAQIAAIGTMRAAEAEPHFWTLCYAASQIRKRKISSEELTRLCLDRIQKRSPRLNAFITVTANTAMETARACDRDLERHVVRGPLHGVPIALKDNIDTKGILTTAASKVYAGRVPTEDAEVARRIFAAGAVLLGKTNLDEFAFAGSGTTGAYGPVHNPWNLDRITGGSSAGNGAGLADGLFFGCVGSDDGGSVRIPGSHCGVVGFKPSFARASTRGIVPSAYSLDCPGPMTRTVEDAAYLIQILAGFDPLDAITLDRAVPDYSKNLRNSVAQVRIGVPRPYFFERLDPDVAVGVEAAINMMRHKVREVRDVTLPEFHSVPNGGTGIELYHYHEPLLKTSSDKYTAYSLRLLERAKTTSAVRYVETLKRIREARRDVRKTFEQVDVLLLPTMREPAPSIKGTMDRTHRSLPSNTSAFNRFGLPALTVPCGFSKDGLPIGLQVVGPYFGERIVLNVAMAYQEAAGWLQKHPA